MRVKVQFFSRLRDVTGVQAIERVLFEGATLADLLNLLTAEFPALNAWRAHWLIAVGLDYMPLETPLADGDEVSLMPPVQGG
jgi:MoaD family protein